MPTSVPKPVLEAAYERAAQRYLHSLPLEHFAEATSQATQREITLASLALVRAQMPKVQVFNELLVQYPLEEDSIGQIVPDNMVVLSEEPIEAMGSFNVPLQHAKPFWVPEYVSKQSSRKDYHLSLRKYEQELRVPYYSIFYPDNEDMTLFQLDKSGKYVSVKPNKQGRCPIRKLDLEIGILDHWMRYWFQGELLPLPGELLGQLEAATQRLQKEFQRAEKAERAMLEMQKEMQKMREEMEKLRKNS